MVTDPNRLVKRKKVKMTENVEVSEFEERLAAACEGELGEDQPDPSLPQEEL